MKLTEKTFEALEYLQAHDGRATTEEMKTALGCEKIASITGRVNSLVKNGLAYREKVAVEGEDKPLTYVQLTDDGINFVQSEDEE
jgi:predicted transcriptional regulator